MGFKEFFFSYKTILKFFYNEKKYFKMCKKIFGYPYKYFLDIFRSFFLIKKINLDKMGSEKFKEYSLDQLFIFFNSDKGSQFDNWGKIIKGHNYSALYEHHFAKFRFKKKVKILEIGCLFGSSAASFLKYFHNAEIYCLDVNPFQIKYISKKIKKIYFNSSNIKTVRDISNYFDCEFDIIVDDGSHNKKDQIVTLNYFLPKIKDRGLYVVEDTCEYIRLPQLNDDKLDYGVNEFVQSVFETGGHFSKYLTDLEKKDIKKMINKFYLEKGNFIHNNESLPEIIFIEKK